MLINITNISKSREVTRVIGQSAHEKQIYSQQSHDCTKGIKSHTRGTQTICQRKESIPGLRRYWKKYFEDSEQNWLCVTASMSGRSGLQCEPRPHLPRNFKVRPNVGIVSSAPPEVQLCVPLTSLGPGDLGPWAVRHLFLSD